MVKSKPLQEECESSHEGLLAAESDPSPSTSSHSAIEPSTEPGHRRERKLNLLSFLLNLRMIHLETIETPRMPLMPN
jgi:hypothetical protein